MMDNTPKTIAELDEMRARAMCAEYHLNHFEQVATENYVDKRWGDYLPFARAVREADAALGLVTVPVDMTEEMQRAALLVPIKGDHGWVCKLVAPGSKCYADYPLCDRECSGDAIHTLQDDSPVDVYRAMLAASPFAKKEASNG